MFIKVLLVVASVSVLVTARPTEENSAGEPGLPTLVLEDTPLQLTQNGEGELDVGQNGEVNLQLADLVDPTESTPPPSVVVPRRRFSGYGRKKRESTDNDTTETDEEELLVNPDQTDDQPPRRDFGDLTRFLNIAGAKPQIVDPSGGYSGRKRRSSVDDHEEEVVEVVDPAAKDEAEPPRRDFGDLTRLLNIAGAKSQVVDPSGGYSGRRRRSSVDDLEEEVVEVVDPAAEDQAEPPRRNFGDLTRLLNIAGAKPQVVDPSGGYSGRRRRSSIDDHEEEVVEVVDPAAEDQAEPPRRDFGDLARLLNIAGAKPQAVDLSGSYSGRRRRSDNNLYGLVPEVDLDAVKIKPHGKNGQQVQNSASGIPVGRAIFEPSFSRVKRDDFIPFNEYDQRRVKTLKIEQNDFLALPKRLEQEEEQTDRQKRKFQVEE